MRGSGQSKSESLGEERMWCLTVRSNPSTGEMPANKTQSDCDTNMHHSMWGSPPLFTGPLTGLMSVKPMQIWPQVSRFQASSALRGMRLRCHFPWPSSKRQIIELLVGKMMSRSCRGTPENCKPKPPVAVFGDLCGLHTINSINVCAFSGS